MRTKQPGDSGGGGGPLRQIIQASGTITTTVTVLQAECPLWNDPNSNKLSGRHNMPTPLANG